MKTIQLPLILLSILMFRQPSIAQVPTSPINAAQYCSTSATLDQTCIENAVAADSSGVSIYVPAGSYSGTTSTLSYSNASVSGIHLILDPGTSLNYSLNISGPGYYRSNTINSTGTYSIGTSTFSGNFSAFSSCSKVMIEPVSPTSSNQIGVEFFTIQSANNSQLTINSSTRFEYSSPNISCIAGASQYSGNVASGSNSIPGDFTATLAKGDYVRFDNTSGTDSPGGTSTAYFEIARVADITTSALTLEANVHANYTNPWLVKMNLLSNVSVSGQEGFIQTFNEYFVAASSIENIHTTSYNGLYLYNFKHAGVTADSESSKPVGYGITFAWHGTVANINVYGGESSTDNGTFKAAQVQDVSISNLNTWFDTATSEGAYGFMVDYNFTPYAIWNANDTINGVSVNIYGQAYLAGLRNSTISGFTSINGIEFLRSANLLATAVNSGGLMTFRSGMGYQFSGFYANAMSFGDDDAVTNSAFTNFSIGNGVKALLPARTVWIRSGSSNLTFRDGVFAPEIYVGAASFFINDASNTGLFFDNIIDNASGGGTSVYNPGGAPISLGVSRFVKPVQGPFGVLSTPSAYIGGGTNSPGSVNTVYRCTTAGSLPVGTLTINPSDCGATVPTTLQVN
jgi:hypothetical protein